MGLDSSNTVSPLSHLQLDGEKRNIPSLLLPFPINLINVKRAKKRIDNDTRRLNVLRSFFVFCKILFFKMDPN